MRKLILFSGLLSCGLFAQDNIFLSPLRVPSGASTPAACTVGDVFFKTGVTAGSNWYMCTSTDTWTVNSGSGGSGTVTSVATTSPIAGGTITGTGTITCATCVTSAASLTSNGVLIGGGSQASASISASTTTTNALFATAGAPAFRNFATSDLPSAARVRGIPFSYGDPALANPIAAGTTTTDYITVPYGCTLDAWNLLVDAGTITVKFWKVASGTAIPTSGNSINTTGVSISTGTAIHSTTMSDFTSTTVTANDIMAMNVTAASGVRFVRGVLGCTQ